MVYHTVMKSNELGNKILIIGERVDERSSLTKWIEVSTEVPDKADGNDSQCYYGKLDLLEGSVHWKYWYLDNGLNQISKARRNTWTYARKMDIKHKFTLTIRFHSLTLNAERQNRTILDVI